MSENKRPRYLRSQLICLKWTDSLSYLSTSRSEMNNLSYLSLLMSDRHCGLSYLSIGNYINTWKLQRRNRPCHPRANPCRSSGRRRREGWSGSRAGPARFRMNRVMFQLMWRENLKNNSSIIYFFIEVS
jgi:hypothetical protein